jgi:hypothetical protein
MKTGYQPLKTGLWLVMVGVALLAGCVPARVPENLDDTPGPPVVVADQLYENSAFTARYPEGWRVVTSEARATPGAIFVAPDERTTIQLSVGGLEAGSFSNPDIQIDIRGLTLDDDTQVTAIYTAPAEAWETYLPIFEWMLTTVQPVSSG